MLCCLSCLACRLDLQHRTFKFLDEFKKDGSVVKVCVEHCIVYFFLCCLQRMVQPSGAMVYCVVHNGAIHVTLPCKVVCRCIHATLSPESFTVTPNAEANQIEV